MEERITELKTKEELLEGLPVLQELRPYVNEEQFFSIYDEMKKQGYRLFALRSSTNDIAALAGVQISMNLYNGRHVYIHELVTASVQRSKGYGKKLLTFLEQWGKENGCEKISLTSGVQRVDAHRFYERERFEKVSYSFRKSI